MYACEKHHPRIIQINTTCEVAIAYMTVQFRIIPYGIHIRIHDKYGLAVISIPTAYILYLNIQHECKLVGGTRCFLVSIHAAGCCVRVWATPSVLSHGPHGTLSCSVSSRFFLRGWCITSESWRETKKTCGLRTQGMTKHLHACRTQRLPKIGVFRLTKKKDIPQRKTIFGASEKEFISWVRGIGRENPMLLFCRGCQNILGCIMHFLGSKNIETDI